LFSMSAHTAQILIRPAYADDYDALARLAALDSADGVPPRPLLIAEVDGTLRAALSLRDGSAIADPFFSSARLVTLLQAHASTEATKPRRVRVRVRARLRSWPRPAYARG
jgi:hypothetical protein